MMEELLDISFVIEYNVLKNSLPHETKEKEG